MTIYVERLGRQKGCACPATHRMFAKTVMTTAQPPIDWDRVERWTAQILAGDPAEITATFPAPVQPSFAWNPDPGGFPSEKLSFLLTHWAALKPGSAIPSASTVDPLRIKPVLGYVMLLDPIDGGMDFRYRLFGSIIAQVSGLDLTGQLASSLHASTAVVEFGLASYRAVIRRPEPLYTIRSPIGAYHTARWHRLALPLADDTGVVMRLIAVSLPVKSNGQVIE